MDENTNPIPSTSTGRGGGRGRGRGAPVNNTRGRGNNWRPRPYPNWRGRNNQQAPREKPTSISISGTVTNSSSSTSSVRTSSTSVAPHETTEITSSFAINRNSHSYPGWQLYFPQDEYNSVSPLVRKIQALQTHFKSHPSEYHIDEYAKVYWFPLSILFLLNDSQFTSAWTTFNKELTEQPEHTLNIAGAAMHKLIPEHLRSSGTSIKLIRARVQNFEPVVNLRAIKGNNYDRMIAIRGTVTRAGPMEVLSTWMAFACSACKAEQAIKQPEGKNTVPTKCIGNCKIRSNFQPLFYSPFTRCVAFQKIRVQEIVRGQKYDQARVPRSIDVEMTEDLVESACPGDDITLTGILKVRAQDEGYNNRNVASTFKMYIKAVATASRKNNSTNNSGVIEFTAKDLEAIQMIRSEPCPFRLLVQSLCPRIYGHEMVKAGLILGLFGATETVDNIKKRSELHVLVVGDPGVGKSQMLQACAEVSPRGIFVCGNGNTAAGLTVAVRKEKGNISNGTILEAGALVLADQGICCIDEFDKMSANHHALLEVMEQQVVSVAKAGVLCSLPARTSILAAANPVGGHYNRSKTVSENLKMGGPLLSRFDLVFILLDRHDQEFDSLMTEHILGSSSSSSSSGQKKSTSTLKNYFGSFNKQQSRGETSILEDSSEEESLQNRLKLMKNEEIDYVPPALIQKYIAYARKNCQPILSPEAVVELKNFYLELRSTRVGMDSIPVTTRQMEALIRLTQARARTELVDVATHAHALEVISIMKFSLLDIFTSSSGDLQMDRSIMGSGMSQTTQAKKFLNVLQRRSSTLGKKLFDLNELKELAAHSGLSGNFTQLIESLNNQGYLLKKGQSIYQIVH